MATTRIYVVHRKADGVSRMVDATTRAEALRHVAGSEYEARVAVPTDIVRLMKAGVEVEHPRTETEPEGAAE